MYHSTLHHCHSHVYTALSFKKAVACCVELCTHEDLQLVTITCTFRGLSCSCQHLSTAQMYIVTYAFACYSTVAQSQCDYDACSAVIHAIRVSHARVGMFLFSFCSHYHVPPGLHYAR